MPAIYPGSIRVFTPKVDLVDTVMASHVNLLQDEVTAVQTTLGTGVLASSWAGSYTNPSSHATLSARLTNIEAGLKSATGVHAVSGSVVGTTDSQVLTNKTMSGSSNTFSNIPVGAITGLDSALTNYAPLNVTLNQQIASYTLVLSDAAKQVEISNGSANTLTVPADASVNFPVGTTILIVQTGAGQTTITPASGAVTINGTPGLKLRTQWSVATLVKRAANTWLAAGDLAA